MDAILQPTWATEDGSIKLYLGDCLEVLPHVGPVDAVVMDPPYGIEGGKGGDRRLGKAAYDASWPDTRDYVNSVAVPAVKWALDRGIPVGVTPGIRCMWDYPEPRGLGCFWLPAAVTHGPWGFTCLTPILYYGKDWRDGKGQMPSGRVCTEAAEENGHPCPKPIRAWTWLVEKVAPKACLVADPFMGSGTTGVACVRTGRRFIGIELEPAYFDIARRRIEAELNSAPLFEPPAKIVQREIFA